MFDYRIWNEACLGKLKNLHNECICQSIQTGVLVCYGVKCIMYISEACGTLWMLATHLVLQLQGDNQGGVWTFVASLSLASRCMLHSCLLKNATCSKQHSKREAKYLATCWIRNTLVGTLDMACMFFMYFTLMWCVGWYLSSTFIAHASRMFPLG